MGEAILTMRDGSELHTLERADMLRALIARRSPGTVGVTTLAGARWVRLADVVSIDAAE